MNGQNGLVHAPKNVGVVVIVYEPGHVRNHFAGKKQYSTEQKAISEKKRSELATLTSVRWERTFLSTMENFTFCGEGVVSVFSGIKVTQLSFEFRAGTECSALETNQNPFLKIISSLLTAQDSKGNRTDKIEKINRGEH